MFQGGSLPSAGEVMSPGLHTLPYWRTIKYQPGRSGNKISISSTIQ